MMLDAKASELLCPTALAVKLGSIINKGSVPLGTLSRDSLRTSTDLIITGAVCTPVSIVALTLTFGGGCAYAGFVRLKSSK
mmetsp:Transcript_6655/g.13157  ORF Transcript_6655/g.13157 Transcript_6655/m.13157 type:complete len:81 (-) Transcript_6655:1174-1416(-)